MDSPKQDSDWQLVLKLSENGGLTATAHKNRETVVNAYRAQLAGDLDAWWSIFDPEVEFFEAESLPYGRSSKGLEAAKRGVDAMFSAWQRLNIVIEEFLAGGDLVFAYLRMTATSRKTGKIYDGPAAELFRFRDGKVIEWRPIYWDTHLARTACGVS